MTERLDKRLFKKNRPVIRPLEFYDGENAGDIPLLWDAYQQGILEGLPPGVTMEDFLEYTDEMNIQLPEAYIIEDYVNDELKPLGIVLCKSDGWQLEPHVIFLPGSTARTVLRAFTAFLKKTKYRKDIGACLVRVEKAGTAIANKMEECGLLEYVGKIWGGSPLGNQYLYSIRCQRRA